MKPLGAHWGRPMATLMQYPALSPREDPPRLDRKKLLIFMLVLPWLRVTVGIELRTSSLFRWPLPRSPILGTFRVSHSDGAGCGDPVTYSSFTYNRLCEHEPVGQYCPPPNQPHCEEGRCQQRLLARH